MTQANLEQQDGSHGFWHLVLITTSVYSTAARMFPCFDGYQPIDVLEHTHEILNGDKRFLDLFLDY